MSETTDKTRFSYYKRDRIDLAAAVPLAVPLHIQVEPTNACNMKCFFCPVHFDDYKEQAGGLFMLSMEDHMKILGQVKDLGHVRLFSFYMIGEAFVNKNCVKMMAATVESGVADQVQITTNGSLVTEEKWGPICESGLDMIRFSIMGSDEVRHHERANTPIKLETVVNNIKGLKAYRDNHGFTKPKITLRTYTSTPEEGAEFHAKFDGVGDEAFVDFLFDWNGSSGKDEQGRGLLSHLTDEDMYKQTKFFGKHDKQVCPYPFYTLIVRPDMTVTVCSTDWNHLNTVGDLRKETLSQVWRGAKLRAFQLMHLERRRCEHKACKDCGFIHNGMDNLDGLGPEVLG